MLDLNHIQTILVEAVPQVLSATDETIQLVIGNTGAGKSTLVNYFLGRGMKKVRGGIAEPILPNPPAKIGNSSESMTIFPQIFKSSQGITYCDCPGFLDTRTKEETICASITMEMSVKAAKAIGSILVVIDYYSIDTDRGESLKKISDILGTLLKNPQAAIGSLLFLINKTPSDISHADVVAKIFDLIRAGEKRLEAIYQTLDKINLQECKGDYETQLIKSSAIELDSLLRILRVLKLMHTDANTNLFLIDIFDNGETRSQLNENLKRISIIDKEQFDFDHYSYLKTTFMNGIEEMTMDACQLFEKKQALSIQIKSYLDEIKSIEQRLGFYQGGLREIFNQTSDLIQLPVVINNLEKQISALNNRKYESNSDISTLKISESKNEEELQSLNVSTPVLYWQNHIQKDASIVSYLEGGAKLLGGLAGGILAGSGAPYATPVAVKAVPIVSSLFAKTIKWVMNNAYEGKLIQYKDIPFVSVDRRCENGIFTSEMSSQIKGEYSVTYKPNDRFGKQFAKIEIYVETKKIPINVKRIKLLEDTIEKNKEEQKYIQNKIKILESEISLSHNLIDEMKNKQKPDYENSRKDYEKIIKDLTNSLEQTHHAYQTLQNEFDKISFDFEKKSSLYYVIKNILIILDLDFTPSQIEFLKIMDVQPTAVRMNESKHSRFFSQPSITKRVDNSGQELEEMQKKISTIQGQIIELQQQLDKIKSQYENTIKLTSGAI